MSSTLAPATVAPPQPRFTKRYGDLGEGKTNGVTYTPKLLADFVAEQIANAASLEVSSTPLRILDPAVGDGELLLSLLNVLVARSHHSFTVYGFDTSKSALDRTQQRLSTTFPQTDLHLTHDSFLNFVAGYAVDDGITLFPQPAAPRFDLIIANPPYVRTQIIGADAARRLGECFGLTGRVDLYHAFLIAMGQVLTPKGTAGIIVSNRFMTTRGGASVRSALKARLALRHIWDLGDTKLFDAAVLPAVILANGRSASSPAQAHFTSIYETDHSPNLEASTPIAALAQSGIVQLSDMRRFRVQHGRLEDKGPSSDIWRLSTDAGDAWLACVLAHSWGTFRDLGKVRVGVKTCADRVFIRSDWEDMAQRPELLRPLTTHHIARSFRATRSATSTNILYPHESADGRRRPVDLRQYPNANAYLEEHRAVLEARGYVTASGRRWYEIWVPQDPAAWNAPKLVFRDISERPTFWIDLDGTVVNGDCYWLVAKHRDQESLLWLAAAVANSTFAEAFYDHRFNNKLYSGRRRFITQYVEEFPLPDPTTNLSQDIIALAQSIFAELETATEARPLVQQLDEMIWDAFGLIKEFRG